MKFQAKKLENGQGQWLVIIDGQQWQDALKKAKKELIDNIQIKGFRKGKAPKSEVDRQVTLAKIYQEAYVHSNTEAYDFAFSQKSDVEPLNTPNSAPMKVDDESLTIAFTFDLKPEITLGKYKNIQAEGLVKEEIEVTDLDVENVLKEYQEKFAMETVKPDDASIVKGDVVTFDFTGYVDGKTFPGGESKNYKLEIGSNTFIPGFEDSMVGLKRGNDQSIQVTFPAGYSEELGGKEAEFKLNINEIAIKELPPVDDSLATDLGIEHVNTLADLKENIKKDVLLQKTSAVKSGYVDRIILEIINSSKIVLSPNLIAHQVKHLWADLEKSLQKEGMTLKQYQQTTGLTDDNLNEQLEEDAKNELSAYLVNSEIIKRESLDATESEIESRFDEFSKMYGISIEQLKTIIRPDQVKDEIVNEKLIDFLYENN